MQKGPLTCLESHGGTARPGTTVAVLPEVMVCRVPGMRQAPGHEAGQTRAAPASQAGTELRRCRGLAAICRAREALRVTLTSACRQVAVA